MAILSSMDSKQRDKYIGWGEAAVGLGMLLGPVIGGLLYEIGGYTMPFAIFAIIYVVMYPYIAWVLCTSIEKEDKTLI